MPSCYIASFHNRALQGSRPDQVQIINLTVINEQCLQAGTNHSQTPRTHAGGSVDKTQVNGPSTFFIFMQIFQLPWTPSFIKHFGIFHFHKSNSLEFPEKASSLEAFSKCRQLQCTVYLNIPKGLC